MYDCLCPYLIILDTVFYRKEVLLKPMIHEKNILSSNFVLLSDIDECGPVSSGYLCFSFIVS